MRCRKRIIAIEGPLGTGKSSIATHYISAHCAENPGAVWLVVRRTYQMLVDNTVKSTWLPWFRDGEHGKMTWEPPNFKLDFEYVEQRGDKEIRRRARGDIRFRSADNADDIGRFMGGEYAGAWLEEVCGTHREEGLPDEVYIGLNLRLRQPGINWSCRVCASELPKSYIPEDKNIKEVDCPNCGAKGSCRTRYHVLLTFNPPSTGHWVNKEFPRDLTRLDEPNRALFFINKTENFQNLPHGYYDEIRKMLGGREDWATRFIDGKRVPIGKATCIFDQKKLVSLIDKWVQPAAFRGVLRLDRKTNRFTPSPNEDGPLRIWEYPKRPTLDRYVMGCDSGRGLEKDNPSCAIVLSRATGNVVAEWWGHLSPEAYAREVAALGWYYNETFVVPEVEPSVDGRAMCHALEHDCKYGNIYMQRKIQNIAEPIVRRHGFPMGRGPKVYLVGTGREIIDEIKLNEEPHPGAATFKIPDEELLLELLSFVNKPDGKMEADEGGLDDRVIAWLLALEGCQQEGAWIPKPMFRSTPDWMAEVAGITSGPTEKAWMRL